MKDNKKKKLSKKDILLKIALVAVLFIIFTVMEMHADYVEANTVSYNDFQTMLQNGEIESITIDFASEKFSFVTKEDEAKRYTDNPKYDDFKKDLLQYDVKIQEKTPVNFAQIVTTLIYVGLAVSLLTFLRKEQFGADAVGKVVEGTDIRLDDVAGLKELKTDIQTIIDFIKQPQRYRDAGAKMPSGILFYGPPGTGKTMLAKAIAGEAGVNFVALVGSDIPNKYVGVSGERIRRIFARAKQCAPCIIFIDELDAIGGKRHGEQHPSDRQTLNALLSELDGFDDRDGVFVMAATNRVEDLDPALIRPGRFDSIFAVPIPATAADRMEVVNRYAKNKRFDETVDLASFAKQMLGCSPADIEAVLNEAAILATREGRVAISREDMDNAFLRKVMKGHVSKNDERDSKELRLIAWHEAGHALVGAVVGQIPTKVTIAPSSSGAGGFTMFTPSKLGLYSQMDLMNAVKTLYAGRAAEVMLAGDTNVTSGAMQDIDSATRILRDMVEKYGMDENGGISRLLNYELVPNGDSYVTATMGRIAESCYAEAAYILQENADKLKNLTEALLEKETLSEMEIKWILADLNDEK